MVSTSDAITAGGRNKVKVVWELSVSKIDEKTCEYKNHIHASATDEFLAFLEKNNIPFERAKEARQQASDAHNREETPNFAKSLERLALTGERVPGAKEKTRTAAASA
jgi:hypothetical protein